MQIQTKADSVRLYESGFFGNKGLTWQSIEDYMNSDFPDPVVLRYRDPGGGGGPCVYDLIGWFEVSQAIRFHQERGYAVEHMWINAQMPDQEIVVQGEYWISETNNLSPDHFFCSEEKVQMRRALASSGKHITGFAARELLRRRMDSRSYSNFQWLLETFPGHVIELSVYNKPVGLDRWNSVVWEVRSY